MFYIKVGARRIFLDPNRCCRETGAADVPPDGVTHWSIFFFSRRFGSSVSDVFAKAEVGDRGRGSAVTG